MVIGNATHHIFPLHFCTFLCPLSFPNRAVITQKKNKSWYISKELLPKNENKCFLPQQFGSVLHLGALETPPHSLVLDFFL